ncbi:MAG: Collagenase [Myxococcales bacterium]|nr:Collagenase [Myxococcales bacterium]
MLADCACPNRAFSTLLRVMNAARFGRVATCLLLAAAIVGGATNARADDGDWEQVSNKDGILVQRRTVSGFKLKEFRGRGIVQAPIGRVLAVLLDASRRAEWMPSCADEHLVEQDLAARTQISYHRTKAPWPVSDRDSVNRASMIVEADKHRVVLPFEAIPFSKIPPVKGVVRMPFMRGHWILIPVDGGRATDTDYQVFADPGGSLPDWLANLASKTLPRETIAGLRKQASKVEYTAFEAQIAAAPETKALLETAR